MRLIVFLILLPCFAVTAQSTDPGRPNRPDKPMPPGLERQVERNIQRAITQIDKAAARAQNQADQRLEQIAQKRMTRSEPSSGSADDAQTRMLRAEQQLDRRDMTHEPAIKRQWVILLPSAVFQQLSAAKPSWLQYITESKPIELLDEQLLTLTVPQELDELSALAKILPTEILALTSRNYVFTANQVSSAAKPRAPNTKLNALAWRFNQSLCQNPANIGLVDSLINTEHMAFTSKTNIVQQRFSTQSTRDNQAHATAIASILVGESTTHKPLIPFATVFNAAVLANHEQHTQASLSALIQGVNWLVGQQVQVMNFSLSGPDNPLLQRMITAVAQKRIVMVAAVGNEGPAAPVRFPAGYNEVIAVTAVDSQHQLYRWAVTGHHIDFAAPGVNLYAASAQGDWGTVTGTSFASPIVAAYIACLPHLTDLNLSQIKTALGQQAKTNTSPNLPYPLLIPGS